MGLGQKAVALHSLIVLSHHWNVLHIVGYISILLTSSTHLNHRVLIHLPENPWTWKRNIELSYYEISPAISPKNFLFTWVCARWLRSLLYFKLPVDKERLITFPVSSLSYYVMLNSELIWLPILFPASINLLISLTCHLCYLFRDRGYRTGKAELWTNCPKLSVFALLRQRENRNKTMATWCVVWTEVMEATQFRV